MVQPPKALGTAHAEKRVIVTAVFLCVSTSEVAVKRVDVDRQASEVISSEIISVLSGTVDVEERSSLPHFCDVFTL